MSILASNFTSNSLSGTAVISGGNVSISLTTIPYALEGDKSFVIKIRKDNAEGTVLSTSAPITIKDRTSIVSLTANTATVAEGNLVAFTIVTANVLDGVSLFYSVLPATANVTAADFTANTGSAVITNNTATFVLQANADLSLMDETGETFKLQLRTNSSTGNVVYTAANVAILDTSSEAPVYTLTPVASSVNEGSSLTFNAGGARIPNGTYYWSVNNTTTAAGDFSASSGSFTITSNSGSFTITPTADATTEGAQTFTVSLRTGSTSGTIVATSSTVTINDTSLSPTYTLTPASSSVNEGSSLTFNAGGTNIVNGTYYYTVNTNAGDFGTSSGSFTITSNSGSFTVTPTADATTEGSETFTVSLRTGSTSGTVVATSSTVTINDTSRAPVTVDYLVVAGGGSGYKGGGGNGGPGGGGGGYLTGQAALAVGTPYTITVGAGGARQNGPLPGQAASAGGNSLISGSGFTTITAIGGGGAYYPGGSGGGGGGTGTPGQGNPGGSTFPDAYGGAGGGGWTFAGSDALRGPTGSSLNATGGPGGMGQTSPLTPGFGYSGGGGGGGSNWPPSNAANGGGGAGGGGQPNLGAGGGGGPGANMSPAGLTFGTNGATNTGGGGGGGNGGPGFLNSDPLGSYWLAGSGGSGTVILAIPNAAYPGSAPPAATILTPSGSYPGKTIMKFTSSGTITL
jgi:hypothetical protein